jgi:apolipoprotein N-acyltransferase
MTTAAHNLAMLETPATEGTDRPLAAAGPSAALRTRVFLLGPLTGLLLWLCYFPVGWGWLGWVALVPLLGLVRAQAPRWRIYLSAWAGGLLFFWVAIQWMRVADDRMYYTWGALATYCSLYFPLTIWLLRLLERRARLPLLLGVPAVWTALELVRAHLMTGFPWYFLSHTQHDYLLVTQIADLGGAYLVTFLVAAGNALVFEWLCRSTWLRTLLRLPDSAARWSWRGLAIQSALVVLFLGFTVAYGVARLGEDDFAEGPRIALIQSNLDQRIRVAASIGADEAADEMLAHNLKLSARAAAQQPPPALIIWPETSYPLDWLEPAPGVDIHDLPPKKGLLLTASRRIIVGDLRPYKTAFLLGLNGAVLGPGEEQRRYNSAVLIQADGQQAGRYDKMHRVPFGEYVPLVDWLPWIKRFAPYDHDYSVAAGTSFTRFPLGEHHFGVVICYEDTDPALARQYAGGDGAPPADFLVNISNDGWFNGTEEHEQHLAICRFRAIECRRAIVRAVNMGVSAVVDGNGRVLQPECLPQTNPPVPFAQWVVAGNRSLPVSAWGGYKKVAGVLTASVPIDSRASLYARWGDWLPWLCWLIIGLGLVRATVCPARG